MPRTLDPFRFVLIALAGWRNQHQRQIIEYLREENRVLREQLGERRLRFHDDQRRRLALQLHFSSDSESMGEHDSGSDDWWCVGWGHAGAVGVVAAGGQI